MRALAWLVVLVGLGGCALPEPPLAPPSLDATTVESLSLSAGCVHRGEAFEVRLGLANPEAHEGIARVRVMAQQYGLLVNTEVALAASEAGVRAFPAQIDHAGVWTVFVMEPRAQTPSVELRVVERHARC